ncbi:chorismate mutase [Roseomonas sp. E05]|uniref:chorismate mutase n=1 Tax=Roseomonas sp. E05 TaxID=3046310 RepID=UPI0024BA20AD|nr:chorismate mutase [Roseomonas sp. E05]MDJ0390117.1 chorismate mutase [Roseomonas sp. E05]
MPDQTPPDLASLRVEIDRIDDALHDLLMRRADIVAHMAASRVKAGAPSFRPGREAEILRRLLERNRGALARGTVVRLWREIIAASLAQQGAFTVAVPGEPGADSPLVRLARAHFGLPTPLKLHATPSRALASVANGEAAVAVLPAPQEGERPEAAWWAQLEPSRLRVVLALPFLAPQGNGGTPAYAVAPLAPEPTGRDRSLLRLEPGPEHSRARIQAALAAAGLAPRWLLRQDMPTPMALAELEGFLTEADPRLAALPFPRMQILGAYAEPEPEE